MADDEAAAAEAPAAEPAAEEPAAEAPAEAPPSPPAEEAAAEEPAAEPPAAPPPFQRQPSTAEEEKAAEKIEAVVRGKEARQRVEQKKELTKKLSSRGVMSAKKTAEHFDEELARQQSLESVGSKKEWDDGKGAPAAADAKRRPSLGSAKGSRGASKTPEKGRGKSKSPGKERPAAKPAAKPPATQKKRKGRAASPANGTPAAPPAKRAHVAATEEKAAFGALVGRKVNKKFPGSGYYDGVVDSIDATKPATYVIVWEDGMTTKMKDTAVQKILK